MALNNVEERRRAAVVSAQDGVQGAPPRVGMRVLVVDDEEDIRVLLRAQLERVGYEVSGEAGDGEEALALCEADCPDAVILDLLMPRMNGFETIPKLRSKYPDVGIVAYTAVAGDFVRREMARLGIPLLLKSGDAAPLAEALHAASASARTGAV